jgi:flavin reductase (DIM6/NTAB) family NADH-FMN oxidoreductase RutF
MQIPAETLGADAAYRLLVGCVVPRPIAWITTLSDNNLVNAAPFSAFTFVSNKPPMVGVSIGRKSGILKDTARNIVERREFVVNIGNIDSLDQLHMSAQEYSDDVSEIDELKIEVAASERIRTPRVAHVPISLECRLHRVIEFGDMTSGFHVGEVVMFHIQDGLFKDGKIDTRELRPICRLGGPHYATLGDIVTKPAIRVTPK